MGNRTPKVSRISVYNVVSRAVARGAKLAQRKPPIGEGSKAARIAGEEKEREMELLIVHIRA